MRDPHSSSSVPPSRQPGRRNLRSRLRPFVRRDLRTRIASSIISVIAVVGLSWLAVSALTRIDSEAARELRLQLGLEDAWAVCDGPNQPACSFDDHQQAAVDLAHERQRRLRIAVLDELLARTRLALARLDVAEEYAKVLGQSSTANARGQLGTALSEAAVDLRPVPGVRDDRDRRGALLAPLAALETCRVRFDGVGWIEDCSETDDPAVRSLAAVRVLNEIAVQRRQISAVRGHASRLRARDGVRTPPPPPTAEREELIRRLASTEHGSKPGRPEATVALWLTAGYSVDTQLARDDTTALSHFDSTTLAEALPGLGTELAEIARGDIDALHSAITDPDAPVWHGGWSEALDTPIQRPSLRYDSPITATGQWQLLGAVLFGLAALTLLVIGPMVTATTTAREREAGTLPVLRMTGLSAGDLALAMAIGPNVGALVGGLTLLGAAITILGWTAGPAVLVEPMAVLGLFTVVTHLTAIGAGEALGHRVNALVVGGITGLAVLAPGLIGTLFVASDLGATGLLLGPLPAVLGAALQLTGVPAVAAAGVGGSSGMGATMLGYAVVSQGLLGVACLWSWRRRVEQPWAPLFHPVEGIVLGLVSVGCSALAILDLAERVNARSYTAVNSITFVATVFLLPVIAWLVVASLRRPARAAAVTTEIEARRAFLRFQGVVALGACVIGAAYVVVLHRAGLGDDRSEFMWATVTQVLLVCESVVATLLWTSRKREGKHRPLAIGGTIVMLQALMVIAVYQIEVDHVAAMHRAALPFLVGMEVSSYWLVFLIVLWAAGFGLVLAALLRDRDREREREKAWQTEDDEEDEDDGDAGRRWLH